MFDRKFWEEVCFAGTNRGLIFMVLPWRNYRFANYCRKGPERFTESCRPQWSGCDARMCAIHCQWPLPENCLLILGRLWAIRFDKAMFLRHAGFHSSVLYCKCARLKTDRMLYFLGGLKMSRKKCVSAHVNIAQNLVSLISEKKKVVCITAGENYKHSVLRYYEGK